MKTLMLVVLGMLLVGCATQAAPPATIPPTPAQVGTRIALESVAIPPNGYRGVIAYFRDGNIYTLNLETGEHVRYRSAANMLGPNWHPNGESIVFGYENIYLLDVQRGAITTLIDPVAPTPSSPEPSAMRPRWNIDGTQVIYELQRADADGVYVFDVAARISRRLVFEGLRLESHAHWSPDGELISFTANIEDTYGRHIFTVPSSCVDETKCLYTQLTELPSRTRAYAAAWSPDGRQIAFVGDHEGSDSIYVMNADGSNIVRLTTPPFADRDPAWSPDGQFIAFYRQGEANRDARIYIMRADGSELTEILTDAGGQLDWWMPPTSLNATAEPTS